MVDPLTGYTPRATPRTGGTLTRKAVGPNLNALISRQASKEHQGLTLGLSQGIGSLARALSPPLGGLLFDLGPSWPYRTGALLLVAAAIYVAAIRPAQERALAQIQDDH